MPTISAASAGAFAQQGAALLAHWLQSSVAHNGTAVLALSGGRTPGPVYTQLARHPDIPWSQVTIILADERCVRPDHAASNQRLIRETLLEHLDAQPDTLFPDTTLSPDACARTYAERVAAILKDRTMDVLVLGMGEDGHIASLFPPLPEAAFGEAAAIHTVTDRFAVRDRVSLTLPVLSAAQHVLLLLKGAEKIRLFEEMQRAPFDPRQRPLQEILAAQRTTVLLLP